MLGDLGSHHWKKQKTVNISKNVSRSQWRNSFDVTSSASCQKVMISGERTHLPISRLTFQGICNKLVIFHQAGFKSDPSAIFFYAVDTKRVTARQKKINISICVFVHVHICQTNDLKRATRNQNAVFTNVSEVIYSPLKSG